MQETRYNCFESKIRSTTLLQERIGKQECRNIIATLLFCSTLLLYFGTRVHLFSSDEGSCYVFYTRKYNCEPLASYSVIIQNVIQSYLKTICGTSLSNLKCLKGIILLELYKYLTEQHKNIQCTDTSLVTTYYTRCIAFPILNLKY